MEYQKTLQIIRETITRYESVLKDLREEFDLADANHPMHQIRIAQDIALVCAKLDAMKHLYKILGGV